jgi:isopentenyl diphosphate isomerase/L-lactate dehydrogenase-like FMN-dependent dehydrogenase
MIVVLPLYVVATTFAAAEAAATAAEAAATAAEAAATVSCCCSPCAADAVRTSPQMLIVLQ